VTVHGGIASPRGTLRAPAFHSRRPLWAIGRYYLPNWSSNLSGPGSHPKNLSRTGRSMDNLTNGRQGMAGASLAGARQQRLLSGSHLSIEASQWAAHRPDGYRRSPSATDLARGQRPKIASLDPPERAGSAFPKCKHWVLFPSISEGLTSLWIAWFSLPARFYGAGGVKLFQARHPGTPGSWWGSMKHVLSLVDFASSAGSRSSCSDRSDR
jgi:hypothetical protein